MSTNPTYILRNRSCAHAHTHTHTHARTLFRSVFRCWLDDLRKRNAFRFRESQGKVLCSSTLPCHPLSQSHTSSINIWRPCVVKSRPVESWDVIDLEAPCSLWPDRRPACLLRRCPRHDPSTGRHPSHSQRLHSANLHCPSEAEQFCNDNSVPQIVGSALTVLFGRPLMPDSQTPLWLPSPATREEDCKLRLRAPRPDGISAGTALAPTSARLRERRDPLPVPFLPQVWASRSVSSARPASSRRTLARPEPVLRIGRHLKSRQSCLSLSLSQAIITAAFVVPS